MGGFFKSSFEFSPQENVLERPEIRRQSTLAEVAVASYLEGKEYTEVDSIRRVMQLSELRSKGRMLEPEEINKMNPDWESPADRRMSEAQVEEISLRNKVRRQRNEIIMSGGDSLINKAVSFGASMIPQLLDPIGMAINFSVGAGAIKLLGGALKGTKVAGYLAKPVLQTNPVSGAVTQTFKKTVLTEIAEGVSGNLLSEAAFVVPASRQEQADVDTYKSFVNAVSAGIMFPAAVKGIGKTFDAFKFLKKKITGAPPIEKAQVLVEQQIQSGKRADISDYVAAEKKNSLPELKEQRQALIEEGAPAERINEMTKTIDEIENMEVLDRETVIEKANSRKEDIHYDPVSDEMYEAALMDTEYKERGPEILNSFDEADLELKQKEVDGLISAEDAVTLSELRDTRKNLDKYSEMLKAVFHCVKGK